MRLKCANISQLRAFTLDGHRAAAIPAYSLSECGSGDLGTSLAISRGES